MANPQDTKIAKTLLNKISGFTEVISFKLYGSRARGDGARDSDMDIFIVVPELTLELDRRISAAAWEIGMDNGIVITTVVCTPADLDKPGFRGSPFLNAVANEGVTV